MQAHCDILKLTRLPNVVGGYIDISYFHESLHLTSFLTLVWNNNFNMESEGYYEERTMGYVR